MNQPVARGTRATPSGSREPARASEASARARRPAPRRGSTPPTIAVTQTRPTVFSIVRVQPWLVPRTSTQNGVLAKASKAVPPSHTTIRAAVPAGAAPRGRRSPMRRDRGAESPPKPSPAERPRRGPSGSAPAATTTT